MSSELPRVVGYVSPETKNRLREAVAALNQNPTSGRFTESLLVGKAVEMNVAYFEKTGRWFHDEYPEHQDTQHAKAAEDAGPDRYRLARRRVTR